MSRSDWLDLFPAFAALAEDDRVRLLDRAVVMPLPAGAQVFAPGAPCSAYLLMLDGVVRVRMIADTGREIVLYRVRRGETCVLTTSCLLGEETYPAEGVVEEAATGVVLPRPAFDDLMRRSEPFRRYVFAGLGRRVAEILSAMEAAVFHRIDVRLARHLAARVDPTVAITHQDLAVELGTAREVVSRHLKAFERRGLVRLTRGTIEVVDRAGLADLAE